MRPAFSASFDWLGGVSVGVPSWLFCDFPCPRWLQKLQKASDFCNNFCNNGCKKPSKYPQIEQSTTTFCVIPFRVFSSYGFLRSFCNNGCKTMVTCTYPWYLQQFLQPRFSNRHTVKKRLRQKNTEHRHHESLTCHS